jgi:hypothetical protein
MIPPRTRDQALRRCVDREGRKNKKKTVHMPEPKTETRRSHRTWIERLLLWKQAYETRLWASGHEVIGRGPTAEVSQESAVRRWNKAVAQGNDGSPQVKT